MKLYFFLFFSISNLAEKEEFILKYSRVIGYHTACHLEKDKLNMIYFYWPATD